LFFIHQSLAVLVRPSASAAAIMPAGISYLACAARIKGGIAHGTLALSTLRVLFCHCCA